MIESNSSTSKSYLALDGNYRSYFYNLAVLYKMINTRWHFFALYQDNLTRWRWRAFCWWCLLLRWQGRASSQRGGRTRELQPTTCLKCKLRTKITFTKNLSRWRCPQSWPPQVPWTQVCRQGFEPGYFQSLGSRTFQYCELCGKLEVF